MEGSSWPIGRNRAGRLSVMSRACLDEETNTSLLCRVVPCRAVPRVGQNLAAPLSVRFGSCYSAKMFLTAAEQRPCRQHCIRLPPRPIFAEASVPLLVSLGYSPKLLSAFAGCGTMPVAAQCSTDDGACCSAIARSRVGITQLTGELTPSSSLDRGHDRSRQAGCSIRCTVSRGAEADEAKDEPSNRSDESTKRRDYHSCIRTSRDSDMRRRKRKTYRAAGPVPSSVPMTRTGALRLIGTNRGMAAREVETGGAGREPRPAKTRRGRKRHMRPTDSFRSPSLARG